MTVAVAIVSGARDGIAVGIGISRRRVRVSDGGDAVTVRVATGVGGGRGAYAKSTQGAGQDSWCPSRGLSQPGHVTPPNDEIQGYSTSRNVHAEQIVTHSGRRDQGCVGRPSWSRSQRDARPLESVSDARVDAEAIRDLGQG